MKNQLHQVLLIDDCASMHHLISKLLLPLNVEMLHAYGGQEGLQMAESHRPSLILLDYVMPDCDGLVVLDRLNSSLAIVDTPVIMITSNTDRSLISKAFDKGVCDYVTKPLHANELLARVKAALKTRALMADLTRKSLFDSLTGLPNKSNLFDRLKKALGGTNSTTRVVALMFIDLDRFKRINDSLGHTFGDVMLQEVAQRLRRSVRQTDTVARCDTSSLVARIGGDEFVILLDDIGSTENAEIIAQRILSNLTQVYEIQGRSLHLSASIGLVSCDGQYDRVDDLIRDADIAMYEAKSNGRACYKVFDASMRDRAQSRWKLENDLRRAVQGEQFKVLYQPIIDLTTGLVESVEALVRWQHPERGLLAPGEFIPMAEETGMIVSIGEQVLRIACRDFVDWCNADVEAAPGHVNINLSRQQLVHRDFMQSFTAILCETGMDASMIHLEITESEMMNDLESAIHAINALRDIGVKIELDDFGTGYSSLACLHQIPIDVIKLDRSLIEAIDQVEYFRKLVHLVIQLLSKTKVKVIAEGIETLSQLRVLSELDCPFGQGFYFSKPIPASEIQKFVRNQRTGETKTRERAKLIPLGFEGAWDYSKSVGGLPTLR